MMMSSVIFVEIAYQLAIGIGVPVVLLVSSHWLSQRQRALSTKSEQTAQAIAQLVQRREAEQRAAVLEKLVDRLPAGVAPDQFVFAIEAAAAKLAITDQRKPAEVTAAESLVKSYHEQALNQANIQFVISVIAAVVGFVWVLWSGSQIDPQRLVTVAKVLPGIVVDTVAYLFLRQAAETRQRATELFDRLRTDRQGTESVLLVAAIEDSRVRSAVRAQIALHMAGLTPQPIDVSSFLLATALPAETSGGPPRTPPDQGS